MDYLKVPQPDHHLQFDTPLREAFFNRTSCDKLDNGLILGKGSYGTVYEAIYKSKIVAIKTIVKHDVTKFLSLKRESNILNWHHKNIMRIFKIVDTHDYGAIVMEKFKNAKPLQFILDQHGGKVGVRHRLHILRDIASALNFCHTNQICHADVKPLNIMVVVEGPRSYVCKLFDFGCSFRVGSDDVPSNATGTARYCAPELLRGKREVTTAVDIFSLGIVMWQLKENEIPYSAIKSNDVVIFQVVSNNLRPDSTILLINELKEKLSLKDKLPPNLEHLCKSDLFDILKVSPKLNTPLAPRSANRQQPSKKREKPNEIHGKIKRSRKNLFQDENLKVIKTDDYHNLFTDSAPYLHDKLFDIENNYIKLFKESWHEDPNCRPSSHETLKIIQQLLECLEP